MKFDYREVSRLVKSGAEKEKSSDLAGLFWIFGVRTESREALAIKNNIGRFPIVNEQDGFVIVALKVNPINYGSREDRRLLLEAEGIVLKGSDSRPGGSPHLPRVT